MSVPLYKSKRATKASYNNKSIRAVTAELDELEIDYSNFENDEVPNDFICFNVPITQSLEEITASGNIHGRDHSNSISTDSLSSTNSSPVLSDDSFLFPNLENNSKAFNVLDSDVQNLTLEFNSNVDFLKREQLTQQRINKKKINQISKKITKDEKFWIKFLNECYSSSMGPSMPNNNVLNKDFSNNFNIKLSNHLNKFEIYSTIASNTKNLNNTKICPTKRSNTISSAMSASTSRRNSNTSVKNVIRSSMESDYIPNILDNDLYELSTKQYISTFGLNDLRYKKKYALPNNNSVESLSLNNSTNNGGGASLYSIVNATNNSCVSIDSINSTFSLSPENPDISTFSSPVSSNSNSPTYNFYKQQNITRESVSTSSTPRSSVLSVSSIGSFFKANTANSPSTSYPSKMERSNTTPSSISLGSINKLNGKVVPSWWLFGLSTSPLPPLLLKFSVAQNSSVNETIDSMNLRSIVWYLSTNNFINMNMSTFHSLNNDVSHFIKHFDYYIKLANEIELINDAKHPTSSAGSEELIKLVKGLKQFLSQFPDKDLFQKQLAIFKSVTNDINSLKVNSSMKQNLKTIILNFYFYLFDIGLTNIAYNKEMVPVTYILLLNVKNIYLTFNCLINLTNKNTKIPLFQHLLFNSQTKLEDEKSQREDQESLNMNATKTFIKLMKNNLPQLYAFFRNVLNFHTFSHFSKLAKLSIRKIFNTTSVINDQSHRHFLERFLDIAFLDKNNNLFVYLLVVFLQQHQDEFLVKLAKELKSGKRKTINLKYFIQEINNSKNELLFKNSNADAFLNDIKSILIKDLNNELSVDDILEFEQLGIQI